MMKLVDFTVADCLYNDEHDVNPAIRQLNSNKNVILYDEGEYYSLDIIEVDKKTFILKKDKQLPETHTEVKWRKTWKE